MKAIKLSVNQKMRLIGLRIGFDDALVNPKHLSVFDYDIEETFLAATFEAENDLRILRILISWVKVHGDYVLIEKLLKRLKAWEAIKGESSAFQLLAATAVIAGFSGWKRGLRASVKKPIYPGNKALLLSSIELKGVDPMFSPLGIMVPHNYLSPRESDVFTVHELLSSHLQYRNRHLFGANWRSDIITAIESGIENPFRISKVVGCSYEPAHRVFGEYQLLRDLKLVG